ncbi:MAG: hypothetical protein OHK0013_16060 [Sandaracinaceae bacterium]
MRTEHLLGGVIAVLSAWWLGCGGLAEAVRDEGAPAARARGSSARADAGPVGAADRARGDARTLRSDATFAELVGAARTQDRLRDQDSDAGCLLRRRPARLEADLAAAVRPLPEAPSSLAGRLGSVSALTRYGAMGAPDAALALVAFTTTRPLPDAPARAVVITAEAIWVAPVGVDGGPARRVEITALSTLVDGAGLVLVTAEGGVSVDRLADVLAALPPSLEGRVALAVALPEGTRLPDVPALEGPETVPVCELAPLADEAWGELDPARLRAGLAPLAEQARTCVGSTEGLGAAGGRVTLTLRIGPGGRVDDACVSEDTTGDGALRACLVRAARALVLEAPVGGSVDVALPLRLEPGIAHRQRPLCP